MAYRDSVIVFTSYIYVHIAIQQGRGRDVAHKALGTDSTRPDCRPPVPTLQKYPADSRNHVVLIRKSRFCEVAIGVGEELSVADLEALITKVVRAADKIGAGHAVGALTSDNKTGGGRSDS
ncbi:hypothetical protein PIIN_11157 [Serendipita indica DSM 11827]|uniref:Uncharacterized protein n=1 Tax=Serendipita indica (strain DSM 11827) TaxID=1109443 RepID=G4U0T2_SERID|nr:hypothetical protein PIIN_11157 [Serendipita indica DSM 11827]